MSEVTTMIMSSINGTTNYLVNHGDYPGMVIVDCELADPGTDERSILAAAAKLLGAKNMVAADCLGRREYLDSSTAIYIQPPVNLARTHERTILMTMEVSGAMSDSRLAMFMSGYPRCRKEHCFYQLVEGVAVRFGE